MENKYLKAQRHKKGIANKASMAHQYELAERNMRNIRSKLDLQLDMFTRIHFFAQMALQAHTPKELYETVTEGIVVIFQLEFGAIFSISPSGDSLVYLGGCNMDECGPLRFSREWITRQELCDFKQHNAFQESPVTAPPFQALNLAHVLYMPIFGNNRKLEGVIMGGITNASRDSYDFLPNEILSSFMGYGRTVNGIFNNMASVKEATNAVRAKTQFLSNLSHEIRTPVNAIVGMTQIAELSQNIDEIKKCLRQISVSSRHLTELLNDVLDISKIEEGKFILRDAPFSLKDAIESLLSDIRQTATEKNQELVVNYHVPASDSFVGDSARLSQVLNNLLSNAIKFTNGRGRIQFDIDELSRDAEKATIRFSVTDTGIGIPESFTERLFDPFEQSDNNISRRYGGTGLGLAIGQRIVELMGGHILVESKLEKGSRFSFSIRLAIDNGSNSKDRPMSADQVNEVFDFSGRSILVVDDVEINREIVYAFLKDTGAKLESAANGHEAVDMVKASAVGYYDLILMDVQMPVMDGCTAAGTIRALDRPDAKTLTILALTANAFKEDIELVAAAGMNGHIAKPVDYESTLLAIKKALFQNPLNPFP
ncbi:MAG: response regulator [Acidobacteriota bacterium]|nr:response regulator [Acidobacteriota bacterium]